MRPSSSSETARTVARTLRVDAATAEAVTALRSRGIPSILLKGPSIEHWLGSPKPRPYVDTDLLVPWRDTESAERVLGELGYRHFRDTLPADAARQGLIHATTWTRPDGAIVDLHVTLPGVDASPGQTWDVLSRLASRLRVGGVEVEALNREATGFQLAVHAAVHGADSQKTLNELAEGLEQLDSRVWAGAAEVAEALGAWSAFAAGLRLLPAGARLVAEMGLPEERSVEIELRVGSAPRGALAFEHLARAAGPRAKLEVAARRLAPPAEFMRVVSPLARRGRAGLAAAYVVRALGMPYPFVRAFRVWHRARGDVERSR